MKYYSRKRIVLSILAAVILLIIVAVIIEDSNPSRYSSNRESTNPFFGGLIAGVSLLAILLPKIWWNFVLDRIREIAKAVKEKD